MDERYSISCSYSFVYMMYGWHDLCCDSQQCGCFDKDGHPKLFVVLGARCVHGDIHTVDAMLCAPWGIW
jgi:hypothetical protein